MHYALTVHRKLIDLSVLLGEKHKGTDRQVPIDSVDMTEERYGRRGGDWDGLHGSDTSSEAGSGMWWWVLSLAKTTCYMGHLEAETLNAVRQICT